MKTLEGSERELIVTADDYGLSRHSTDRILETIDAGTVNNVSIFANGGAVEYAIDAYAQRARKTSLSLHFNLTEGKALSTDSERVLTDGRGFFKYSPAGLLFAYYVSDSRRRKKIRDAVQAEARAQLEHVRGLLQKYNLTLHGVDGHEHVHMVPFVFDVLIDVAGVSYVRITNEMFFTPDGFLSFRTLPQLFLRVLSERNRAHATRRGMQTPDFFLGFFFSGRMTRENVTVGLSVLSGQSPKLVEVTFHPGRALPNELASWSGNTHWQLSEWRDRERELLTGGHLTKSFADYRRGTAV